ncbi:MAG: hypothetical protein A2Y10_11070 [Planctomycetes bacterium GWF2_41_51]|nr:MAG: hypothetical protein A2Y10_11070 [Planctomycetes bacterium GWF2_41_51]HBG28410.1 hypothetical protein [Phycisphaerales bacterium]
MNFQRNDLEAFGFEGFVKISHLKTNGCDIVPKQMGVYIVVNENPQKFNYLKKSIGGYFKDKDPTVSILELKNNWVDNAYVVYIGKAGGVTSNATLFKRINQYIQFGKGKKIGHRGGRYIWQLKDSDNLLFAWKPLIDEDPRFIELSLINEFTKRYNKMPFANLI